MAARAAERPFSGARTSLTWRWESGGRVAFLEQSYALIVIGDLDQDAERDCKYAKQPGV